MIKLKIVLLTKGHQGDRTLRKQLVCYEIYATK